MEMPYSFQLFIQSGFKINLECLLCPRKEEGACGILTFKQTPRGGVKVSHVLALEKNTKGRGNKCEGPKEGV